MTTLGGLLPNTQFYFNGGNYTVGDTSLNLLPDQSIQSRSADFSQPATGHGTFIYHGREHEAKIINIIGSQIGEPNASYETGISDFGTNTRINNTTIFANTSESCNDPRWYCTSGQWRNGGVLMLIIKRVE